MGKTILDEKKVKNTYWAIAVAFGLLCLVMGLVCFQYYKELGKTIRAESYEYLQEISKQMSKNASKTINDNFAILETIFMGFNDNRDSTYEELKSTLLEQQEYWKYKDILLIDSSYYAYDVFGKSEYLGDTEYLREAILNKNRSLSTTQQVEGMDCMIFVIPLEGLFIDGKEICALAATYDFKTFDQILSMSAFNGRAYAHISKKDGTVVVRSSSEFAVQTGNDVLNVLELAEFDKGNNLSQIRTDIMQGIPGVASYTLDDIHKYMIYTPLDEQEWFLLTVVPTEAVNGKAEMFLKLTVMLCSVIVVAFTLLYIFIMLSFYFHRRSLENTAYVDTVTGGNTIQKFYQQAEKLLKAIERPEYVLIYSNIEKFKVLNEQYSRGCCDDLLQSISRGITQSLTHKECMGRLFADNFCVLAEYTSEEDLIRRMNSWYKAASDSGSGEFPWISPILEFGVYLINDDTMVFPSMIDRAKLALRENASYMHGKLKYAFYNDVVRQKLFREKFLEDLMESALRNHEFKVHLQPKYNVQTEKIEGAEALVRWQSNTEGMIYPDEFISLFEKNGFITKIDLYVFRQVCLIIKKWLDMGKEPVKVSVNCSRVQLNDNNFLLNYINICNEYKVSPSYLEIELTENIVFQDVKRLAEMINEIHEAGFGCSMDDFGSGYSSLNLIQEIPVDTIKLDKVFFSNSSQKLARTESVVGSILTMTRALNMIMVAEGVEKEEHVKMLRRLGCDYIQGYYYAKPMPISDFETLLFGEEINPV